MDIKFISPSYKRAGKTKTDKWCNELIFAVHKFEEQNYIDNGNKTILLSDKSKGNMARVRNEILNKCDADICVMMDDDIKEMGYIEKSEVKILKYDEIKRLILIWAEQAKELNTVLFGVNLQDDPKFYNEYSPISFQSPVLGTFSCILTNTDLRYDERLGLNEDYDFSLQVLRKYHKILRWNKYFYRADHLTMLGGCGAYRLMDEEKKQSEIMIKKWGNKVVKYDLSISTNPKLSSPYKGI